MVRDARRLQREHLTGPHACDLRQVIVLLSLRGAARGESAGVAMLDGVRIGAVQS